MSSALPSISQKKENTSGAVLMQRCLQLAELGAGFTAPNPLVGAVLVHEGRIIGEGYHQKYGGPHAEVNCIQSVKTIDRPLIPYSVLYVSLEPCNHYGKTPPCTGLIIREKIPGVVIGCRDPFSQLNGRGIEKLIANKVAVEFPVLENLSRETNRRFITFHEKKRPYIILKWAQSINHRTAGVAGKRIRITNEFSNRLIHKWRSEEAGILIGTNTALLDNPELTNRLWEGKNPVRIVIDKGLRLPDFLRIFDGSVPTIVLNDNADLSAGKILFKKLTPSESGITSILSTLHSSNILSVIVEGGTKLLQSFINEGVWDEMRVVTNTRLIIDDGVQAPDFRNANLLRTESYGTDSVAYYTNT